MVEKLRDLHLQLPGYGAVGTTQQTSKSRVLVCLFMLEDILLNSFFFVEANRCPQTEFVHTQHQRYESKRDTRFSLVYFRYKLSSYLSHLSLSTSLCLFLFPFFSSRKGYAHNQGYSKEPCRYSKRPLHC